MKKKRMFGPINYFFLAFTFFLDSVPQGLYGVSLILGPIAASMLIFDHHPIYTMGLISGVLAGMTCAKKLHLPKPMLKKHVFHVCVAIVCYLLLASQRQDAIYGILDVIDCALNYMTFGSSRRLWIKLLITRTVYLLTVIYPYQGDTTEQLIREQAILLFWLGIAIAIGAHVVDKYGRKTE